MSDQSPNLQLPYLAPAQAQKHVTHNEALRMLDALVQIAVLDRDLTAPPGSPAEGALYIIATGASGAWAGKATQLAAWQDGAWAFYPPREGWLAWVADEDKLLAFDGAAWVVASGGNLFAQIGVNAMPDATNRLSVSSAAALLNHDGAGHQLKINKATSADTASLLFQRGFSGRAEFGLMGDDEFRLKVSSDGATWREALVVDRASGAVRMPNTPAPVLNPHLRRVWAKAAAIGWGEAAARLNVVYLGDSLAPNLRQAIDARLKTDLVNSGFAGRLATESGFHDDGNGTNCVGASGDFTNSPIGAYWRLQAGGSKYWGVGNAFNLNPFQTVNPRAFIAPDNVTRVGVYYTRRPGGGVFKVQTSTKGAGVATYADVAGLTAIDTNGALALQYLEVTIAARDVSRFRVEHVSGGECFVVGALVGADIGVVGHGWTAGGMALTDMIQSPRFAELAALVPADLVTAMFLDGTGDSAGSTGQTNAQLVNAIMDGVRAAFPATQVPASLSPWAGKTALNLRKPNFAWFAANRVEAPNTIDQPAQAAAMRANALANGDCFVDTDAIWGTWRDAYDLGVMSEGDATGASTHARIWFYGALAGSFLRETGLSGGAFARPPWFQRLDFLQLGPAQLGANLPANRFKISDGVTTVSMAPADLAPFPYAIMIESSGSTWESGFVFRSTAVGGRTYLIASQPNAGLIMRDLTGNRGFFRYDANGILFLAEVAGSSLWFGSRGMLLTGVRHGTATLVAGVATVTNANLTASARVIVTRSARGGTPGATYEVAPAAGSFTITSRTAADAVATSDTSTVSFVVVEP